MSEEAAFLEALKANPADDTARLVYADWLDEHNKHDKAEYLRLVAAIAQAEQDYAREQPQVARLLKLSETIPQGWRLDTGPRCKVVFYGCRDMANKIQTIKCIRQVSGQGLAEAAGIYELAPSNVLDCVPFEHALIACDYLSQIVGTAVRIHLSGLTALPSSLLYTIHVGILFNWPHQRHVTEEAIDAFADFLQSALGVNPEVARAVATNQGTVVPAENLALCVALHRVEELRRRLSPNSTLSGFSGDRWSIGIWLQTTALPATPN